MDSPKTPSAMTTPKYDMSPATVQYMTRHYEMESPDPAERLVKLPIPITPEYPAYSSPRTEEYVILKYLELFGPSPVPSLISPLPPTPPPPTKEGKPDTPGKNLPLPYDNFNPATSIIPLGSNRKVVMGQPSASERAFLVPSRYKELPRPATKFIGPILPKRTTTAFRNLNRMCCIEIGDEKLRMTRREAVARGLLKRLKR